MQMIDLSCKMQQMFQKEANSKDKCPSLEKKIWSRLQVLGALQFGQPLPDGCRELWHKLIFVACDTLIGSLQLRIVMASEKGL